MGTPFPHIGPRSFFALLPVVEWAMTQSPESSVKGTLSFSLLTLARAPRILEATDRIETIRLWITGGFQEFLRSPEIYFRRPLIVVSRTWRGL